ncbi:MAG: hypothetical protein JW882_02460 [Deltaproteobacteria bacterium]|nr:hypothetical protein [Deltaproteobacteria bacterium]
MSFIIKEYNSLKRRISTFLLAAAARYNLPRLAAFIIVRNVYELQNSRCQNEREINILFFPKTGFNEDIMASFGGIKGYGLYAIERIFSKTVFIKFIPGGVDTNNYLSKDPFIEGKKEELRFFWVQILNILKNSLRIDVVMTGNFSYAEEQEFFTASEKVNIPVVAVHKECLKTPILEDFFKKVYMDRKNPFPGSKICVYNEVEKRIQSESGIFEAQNIIVTGMPRMDYIHKQRQKKVEDIDVLVKKKPSVVFFSFNEKTGFPILGRKTKVEKKRKLIHERLDDHLEKLNVRRLMQSCHLKMVDVANENPEIDVVIKTKGDSRTFSNLEGIFGRGFMPPQNLTFVHGGDPFDLIMNSSVVCSFNSTALLEAIAMNRPVVFPRFYEAMEDAVRPYIIDLRDAVEYADSPEDLVKKLLKYCTESSHIVKMSYLNQIQVDVLNRFTGNTDGKSGSRVRDVIDMVVNERRN